jgi:hypothetical protein
MAELILITAVGKYLYERPLAAIFLSVLLTTAAQAEPLAAPGDMRLRHDLQLLIDTGVINVPTSAWPIALGDIHNALAEIEATKLSPAAGVALSRVRDDLTWEMGTGAARISFGLDASEAPRIIRTFENTPRDESGVSAKLSWLGNRFTVNLQATQVSNPIDGDELRPDGSYVGVALGNWMLTAGWQERWWGPGHDGSLILSTNARPSPGIAIQRNNSTPFKTKWLRWMGPWSFTSFMNVLDDERVINDGWLFGMRGSFRPTRGLEIGISRTAQWCGDGRPCDLQTFLRLLNGNDNQGANVDPEDEPGNQLGGIDVRWTLPRQMPLALYMQWIAEDTRKTGAQLHLWMQQLGVEYWGSIGDASHRTYLERTDSSCHLGALGEGSRRPNCAYNHSIFQTGYRYKGRAIGFSGDGDTLSYSIGSTIVQPAGQTWNISLRYMELNRLGSPDSRHTLTPTPQELTDIQFSHERRTRFGSFHAGVGYSRHKDELAAITTSDVSGFVRWNSQ